MLCGWYLCSSLQELLARRRILYQIVTRSDQAWGEIKTTESPKNALATDLTIEQQRIRLTSYEQHFLLLLNCLLPQHPSLAFHFSPTS